MKLLRILSAISLLAAVSGCLKVDQTLTINADGSGTLDLIYSMNQQTIQQMEAMTKMQSGRSSAGGQGEDEPFDFDEESVREELGKFEDNGITVKSVGTETTDGWKTMNVKLAFENLRDLAETDFFKENNVTLQENEAGNYLFRQGAKKSGGSMGMGKDEMNPAMLEQMAPMFAGMRIVHRIKVPTRIIRSNATETEGKNAAWIFDIDKEPTVLAKIKDLNMEIEFDGTGIDLDRVDF